eukprot:4009836-Amphidinium_carterae.1
MSAAYVQDSDEEHPPTEVVETGGESGPDVGCDDTSVLGVSHIDVPCVGSALVDEVYGGEFRSPVPVSPRSDVDNECGSGVGLVEGESVATGVVVSSSVVASRPLVEHLVCSGPSPVGSAG